MVSTERLLQRLGLAVLFLIPALAGMYLWSQNERQALADRHREIGDDLQRILSHFQRLSDPAECFRQLAGRARRAIGWEGSLDRTRDDFRDPRFRVFAFTLDGRRAKVPGCAEDLVVASERCLGLLRRCASGEFVQPGPAERKFAESFFGTPAAIETLARSPNRLISLEEYGVKRMAGWFSWRTPTARRGFLLMLADLSRVRSGEFATRALARLRPRVRGRYALGIIDRALPNGGKAESRIPGGAMPGAVPLAGTGSAVGRPALTGTMPCRSPGRPGWWPGTPGSPGSPRTGRPAPDSPSRAAPRLRARLVGGATGKLFPVGSRLFVTADLDRRFLAVGIAPRPAPPRGTLPPGLVLALIVAVIGGILFWRPAGTGLSIRWRVALLFGGAGLASLATLFGVARLFQETRQDVLVRERLTRSRLILEKIDRQFRLLKTRIAGRYLALTQRLSAPLAAGDPAAVAAVLAPLQALRQSLTLYLIARDGTVLHHVQSPRSPTFREFWGTDAGRSISWTSRLSMDLCESHVRGEGGRFPPGNHPVMVQELAKRGFQFQNQFGPYDILQKTYEMFSGYVFDATMTPLAMLWVVHEPGVTARAYLDRCRRRWRADDSLEDFRFRILALPDGGKQAPASSRSRDLAELHARITQQHSGASRLGTFHDQPALLTGIPGREITGYNLFLVTPMAPLQAAARRSGLAFLALAGLIALYGMALARVFAGMILRPMQDLSLGIGDLALSRFGRRLEVRTADEFEVIAHGLNEILQEMKERSFARDIHEQLFPTGEVRGTGWTCRGWTRSASEIGGEIFDYQPLGPDRAVFWIARVPGHAIGSALVLAMTKMALRLLFDLVGPSPAAVLRALSERFSRQAEQMRDVEIFLGTFEPATGILSWAQRGEFLIAGAAPEPGPGGPAGIGTADAPSAVAPAADEAGSASAPSTPAAPTAPAPSAAAPADLEPAHGTIARTPATAPPTVAAAARPAPPAVATERSCHLRPAGRFAAASLGCREPLAAPPPDLEPARGALARALAAPEAGPRFFAEIEGLPGAVSGGASRTLVLLEAGRG